MPLPRLHTVPRVEKASPPCAFYCFFCAFGEPCFFYCFYKQAQSRAPVRVCEAGWGCSCRHGRLEVERADPSAVGRPWYRARQRRTEKASMATGASRAGEAGAWSCPKTEALRPATDATSTGACRPEPTSTSAVTRADSRRQHDRRRLY